MPRMKKRLLIMVIGNGMKMSMVGERPNISNMRVFGCHAEVLIEKRYRRKDITDENSDSAIFIGYCRQSAGYIFYIPHKHQVVSRRDAHFNQAYFPARVGETMLIDSNTIKTGNSDDKDEMALPDGNGHHENSIKNNDESNSDVARKLQSKFNKLFNKSDKATKPLSSGAKNPPKTSPDIEENLKLLLDHDFIIRASTKIESAAPHI